MLVSVYVFRNVRPYLTGISYNSRFLLAKCAKTMRAYEGRRGVTP